MIQSLNSSICLTYIGHATTLIEMDSVRLLTDPLLRNRVLHLQRQSTGIDPRTYQMVDAVLISHLHWDHLDLQSLQQLGQDIRLIVPHGAANLLRSRGFHNVDELTPGQSVSIGTVTIEATQAEHDGFRPPFGPEAACLGFLIKGSACIYFAGDTDLFPEMAHLSNDLDVALLPVWGWGPTLGTGHLDPWRAAKALTLLRPQMAIPIHWGTFYPMGLQWLQPQLLRNPPRLFNRYAANLAAEVRIEIVSPGQSIYLSS